MILLTNLNTLFIGQSLHHLVQIDSTNSYAIKLLAKSRPADGTVITADFQSQGRGQFDSSWQSAAGQNLLFSLLLYPGFILPSQQFLLTQAISIGLAEGVQALLRRPVAIKWPNDLYIGDKKAAGMLIQTTLGSGTMLNAVVGIGLNVNQTQFSPDLPNPTSLAEQTGKDWDRAEVLTSILEHIERWYLNLRSQQTTLVQQTYLQFLFRYGEWALYQEPGGDVFSGKITGLSPQGKLELETRQGMRSYHTKEIQFVL